MTRIYLSQDIGELAGPLPVASLSHGLARERWRTSDTVVEGKGAAVVLRLAVLLPWERAALGVVHNACERAAEYPYWDAVRLVAQQRSRPIDRCGKRQRAARRVRARAAAQPASQFGQTNSPSSTSATPKMSPKDSPIKTLRKTTLLT